MTQGTKVEDLGLDADAIFELREAGIDTLESLARQTSVDFQRMGLSLVQICAISTIVSNYRKSLIYLVKD